MTARRRMEHTRRREREGEPVSEQEGGQGYKPSTNLPPGDILPLARLDLLKVL